MAEGGTLQSAESTNSSCSLTCGICLEQYKEPKILPCSHTFCLGCLKKTLSMKEKRAAKALESSRTAKRQETDGETIEQNESYDITKTVQRVVETQKISCPVCKREHKVPSEGLGHFPADLEAQQAMECALLQKSLTKSKVSQKCGSCSKERAITNHCDECGGICQRCSEAHEEFGVFAQHTVVPIKELTPDSLGLKKRTHLCGRHGEKVTMYCERCSQVICHICIVKQHQSHSVSLLEEADEKLREKVNRQSKDVQETQRIFEKYREYIARVDGEMAGESYTKKLREKVSAEFDERIKRLQDKRESLVQHIDIYDSQSKKQVWSEKNAVELVLNKIQAGLRMMQKAQRLVNPADRITMNSESTKILAEVGKAAWSHDSLPRPLVFQTNPGPFKQLQSTDLSPSFVELAPITENDISVSVIDENGTKVRTPKLSQPTIVEVTFSVGMVDEPKFQVLYGKSRQILESVALYENPESKCWNIEFVPRCAGKHLVQTWLGGVAVAIKDDITISGTPSRGSRVRPGPDWVAPDDTMLYLEGTVVSTGQGRVEVDWKQDASAAEERKSPLFLAPVAEPKQMKQIWMVEEAVPQELEEEAPDQSDVDMLDMTEIKGEAEKVDSAEKVEALESELRLEDSDEDEPRPKCVRREHKWGGFLSETYEVELVL